MQESRNYYTADAPAPSGLIYHPANAPEPSGLIYLTNRAALCAERAKEVKETAGAKLQPILFINAPEGDGPKACGRSVAPGFVAISDSLERCLAELEAVVRLISRVDI